MSAMTSSSLMLAGEPAAGRVGEDRAADGEAAADRLRRGDAKAALAGLPRWPPGPAPARRGSAGRTARWRRRCAPTRRRCRGAAASTSRDGCRPRRSARSDAASVDVVARHVARRDHLDQALVAGGRRRPHCSSRQPGQLRVAQRRRVVGMVAHQALGDVLGGPAAHLEHELLAGLERQRPRAGQLDRPCHPPALAGQGRAARPRRSGRRG